jgi:hypothetical protein
MNFGAKGTTLRRVIVPEAEVTVNGIVNVRQTNIGNVKIVPL